MKKIHWRTSDSHDHPACKVVPDTTQVTLTKDIAEVTCKGCLNQKFRRDNPHPNALRIVQGYSK